MTSCSLPTKISCVWDRQVCITNAWERRIVTTRTMQRNGISSHQHTLVPLDTTESRAVRWWQTASNRAVSVWFWKWVLFASWLSFSDERKSVSFRTLPTHPFILSSYSSSRSPLQDFHSQYRGCFNLIGLRVGFLVLQLVIPILILQFHRFIDDLAGWLFW